MNETWSIDFARDAFSSGRRVRTLIVMDDARSEALVARADHPICAGKVIQILQQLGLPLTIGTDNHGGRILLMTSGSLLIPALISNELFHLSILFFLLAQLCSSATPIPQYPLVQSKNVTYETPKLTKNLFYLCPGL